jgi:DNA-binding GntR family transcriptional regulator
MSIPGSELRPVRRAQLRVQARDLIRSAIVTGEIKAREIFTVGALAHRMEVSATPVREALLDLANQGLVEVVPNRGFQLPELTEKDLDELFQLRLLLERGALLALAGSLRKSDVERFRKEAERTVRSAAAGDLREFLSADREFHLGLLRALENERLVDLVGKLRDQTRLYGLPALALAGALKSAAREHVEILEALESGQVDAVSELITKHLRHTRGLWAGHSE